MTGSTVGLACRRHRSRHAKPAPCEVGRRGDAGGVAIAGNQERLVFSKPSHGIGVQEVVLMVLALGVGLFRLGVLDDLAAHLLEEAGGLGV